MMVVRTFVAVLIADDLKEIIAKVQRRINKFAPDVKWVSPGNLHVTLKFLGDVPEDRLAQVNAAVEEAALSTAPFELSLSRLGAFPNERNARVIWIGVDEGRRELAQLAGLVDERLAARGFEREPKPFAAHVTIGRARQGRRLSIAADGADQAQAEDLGSQRVESVVVMRSDLRPDGPVYTPLNVFGLKRVG